MIDTAVKNIYTGNDGNMYFTRFDGTSKLIGRIKQDADYAEEDDQSSGYIKNRPIENSNVDNLSLRYSDGVISAGSNSQSEVKIASIPANSLALNLIDFVSGRFYASGDVVVFNDNIWMCSTSGVEPANPSVSSKFNIRKPYDLVSKVCELNDTRLSAVITAVGGMAQSNFKIDNVFDLYFHSQVIDLPNGEKPENFKRYANFYDGVLTIGNAKEEPTLLSIVFEGKKSVFFDLKVFDNLYATSSFSIKLNNQVQEVFDRDESTPHVMHNGVAIGSNAELVGLGYALNNGDRLVLEYKSYAMSDPIPLSISNLSVSY